jgi:hypothetical protein
VWAGAVAYPSFHSEQHLKHDTSNPDAGNIQRAIDMANGTSLAGTWGYRSYLNTADQRLFGAGIFTFQTPTGTTLAGTFDMGNDLVLNLEGTVQPATGQGPLTAQIRGFGRPGTGTDGWERLLRFSSISLAERSGSGSIPCRDRHSRQAA